MENKSLRWAYRPVWSHSKREAKLWIRLWLPDSGAQAKRQLRALHLYSLVQTVALPSVCCVTLGQVT